MIDVTLIHVLSDNYAYVLRAANGEVAVVDPGEAGPVIEYLEAHKLKPSVIFNTHHHGDHIAGNAEMIKRYGCALAGPAKEDRISGITVPLAEGVPASFGGERLEILETPGHTRTHICLYLPESKILFSGDTLFSMGCGRLFEGDAAMMWSSLQKLTAMPADTQIYCGHEYTLSNGKFCQHIEPENEALKARMAEVQRLRDRGLPTLPVSLETELATNCFLRAGNAEAFGTLREEKDHF